MSTEAKTPKRRVSLAKIEGASPQAVLYPDHGSAVQIANSAKRRGDQKRKAQGTGQGIVIGIILPSFQNIFGVILFLRLPWLVGFGGIIATFFVVFVTCLTTGITASSLSAIATNGQIGGGGNYYLISRSLGPALGASVGLCFFMANALGAAMYLIGTVEAFEMATPTTQLFPAGTTNNIRCTGLIILACAMVLNFVGLKYVTRVSILFLFIMAFSILCMYLGAFVGPFGPNSTPQFYNVMVSDADGTASSIMLEWTGLSAETCNANAFSDYDAKQLAYPLDNKKYDFFGLLSIWFPAVTGFEAGSNRSADLSNPERDIPRGTFFALIISSIIYCSFPIIFGCLAPRSTLLSDKFFAASATWPAQQILVYGVIASTIGAGLTSLISGSRLLAAIANDKVLPILNIFAVKPGEEPRKALACVGIICAAAICIGELNAVAPILTMFFLMCYTCVNLSCVLLHVLKDPNWRPSFRFTHWTISAAGAILCVFIMFAISWWYALIAIAFCSLIFIYAGMSTTGDWGDGLQSLKFQISKGMLYRMSGATHVKNFRLNLLTVLPGRFCGDRLRSDPASIMDLEGSELLKLVMQLSARSGVIWVTSIIAPAGRGSLENSANASEAAEEARKTLSELDLLKKANAELSTKLTSFGIRGFSQVLCSNDFKLSFSNVTQISGLGPVKPNCILVPYPAKGLDNTPDGIEARSQLVSSIHSAVVCDKSMLVAMGESWPSASDQLHATIDIWWFAASFAGDGGLLLLVPCLLRWHRVWRHCKVRVFVVNDTNDVADTTLADTIDSYLATVRISAEVTTVPLVRSFGGASEQTKLDSAAESPQRQESVASQMLRSQMLERVLTTWIKLDVAGSRPCSQDIMEASSAINSVIMAESMTADLVITNLPDLLPEQSALGYCEMLEQIARGLKRVILVHEGTQGVITADN